MPSHEEGLVATYLPKRPNNAHKGTFGRVLVVAGSRNMCGAGFLCAKSALMAGAGLVYWALPQSMQPAFAAVLPEVITLPLSETSTGEIAQSAWELFPEICTCYNPSLVIVGPGMGSSPLLPILLQTIALPILVDADGLNALSRQPGWEGTWPKERPSIFTPHAAEMARLLKEDITTDLSARKAQASTLAQRTGGVALLKGPATWVVFHEGTTIHAYQNPTGGPVLAKGGSGDVLSGLIAGLWAQLGSAEGFSVHTAYKAAVCGAFLHGRAGDLAAQEKGPYSVLATDLVAHISRAFLSVGK